MATKARENAFSSRLTAYISISRSSGANHETTDRPLGCNRTNRSKDVVDVFIFRLSFVS
jgi:hypothetical protein